MKKNLKIAAPVGVAAALAAVAGPLTVAALTGPTVTAAPAAPEFSSVTAPVVTQAAASVAAEDARLAVGETPSFGDGTHIIGEGVNPGTYTSSGTERDCYWERTSGNSGALEEIIANDIAPNPVTVTIEEGDVGFVSQGCGTWTPEGSAPPPGGAPGDDQDAPPAPLPPVVDTQAPAPAPAPDTDSDRDSSTGGPGGGQSGTQGGNQGGTGGPGGAGPVGHQSRTSEWTATHTGLGPDGMPESRSNSISTSDNSGAGAGAKASGGNARTDAKSDAGPGRASSSSKAVVTGG